MRNIAVIVGSLRQGAYTRLVAQALIELAPPTFQFNEVGIGELPFYNQDLETDTPPAQWRTFRERIRSADAVIFVTPEYNRGMPGVLKNAIDVGSRPPKASVWRGKPALVVSQTPGKLGAMAAHQQLRLTLSVIGSPVMPTPEVYLAEVGKLLDLDGKLSAEDTRKYLTSVLNDFDAWIGHFHPLPR
jgi:chromate reductase, NAD(P)H dehydrogenase (quinone)